MKKLIPLLFLIATISICSQSIYTAREGFTYLENIGVNDDYSVIEISAAGFIENSIFEGKAPEWIYICKSNDNSDTIFYEFIVNYDGGSFENELNPTPYYQGEIRNSQ